jgi:ribonuclease HI/predicted  nucleic acid-binding Zn-ribbon protein
MALKASPDDQALLLDLQALDTKLAQLDHKAKSLPQHAVLASLATELATVKSTALERTGAREDIAIELKRLEADVEVVETRIKRDSDRLEASSSVKDVAALEQELTALRKRRDDLEEIELTVMERLDVAEADLASTSAEVAALDERRQAVEAELAAALAEIANERTHTAANRQTIEGKVPADLLALYTKQRERYGTGASLLRFGVSSANGVKLNESDLQAIRAHERVGPLMARVLLIEADGGSRGNPGESGSGAIVVDQASGELLAEISLYGGIASNNVAEYKGMIAGVRRALEIDNDAELLIRLDSKLVVEQMSGRWKIKHPAMAELAAEARELLTGTPVRFEWMPRLQNSRADKLANLAMDLRRDTVR